MIGLAAALSLGLAACSSGGDKADTKQSKSNESSSVEDEVDYAKIAEDSLVSTDMEMLNEHKAQFDEPKHEDRVPFSMCELDEALYSGVQDSATQMFDGDPKVVGEAHALEGSAQEQFEALKDQWRSKACESFTTDTPDGEVAYKRTEEIDAPEQVDEKSWFSACYTLTLTKTDATRTECRVVYVAGDNSIAEVYTQDIEDADDVDVMFVMLLAM